MTARLASPRVLLGLVAALYVMAFPYHPGLRSPNELCRLWQSRALVDFGTLELNAVIARDGMVGDLSIVEGRYYPSKAPLMGFLGAPVYAVLQQALGNVPSDVRQVFWSRLFFTIAPALYLVWLMRRFLAHFVSDAWATSLAATYAVGTLAFSYAEAFMSHQLTAVLLFSAFYAAWRVLEGAWRERGWLVVGALCGLAVLSEYTAALTVLGLAGWVVIRRFGQWGPLGRAVALVVVGGLPFLALLGWYHQVVFGHWYESGYKHLNDAGYQGWHVGGFLGIRLPDPRAFVLSFFSPLRGFFTLSPVLLLGLVGLRGLKAEPKAKGLFSLTVLLLVANAYFTSSFSYDSWGWCVGPRHLTPLIPFLMLPAALWLSKRAEGRPAYGFGVGLGLSSVLVTGLVVLTNYVPDDVSTSLFGLALPLYRDGYWPPTLLWLLGVNNPLSGAVAFVLLAAVVLVLSAEWLRGKPGPVLAAAVAAVVLHVGALAVATQHHSGDQGAVRFLKSVWLAPPPS